MVDGIPGFGNTNRAVMETLENRQFLSASPYASMAPQGPAADDAYTRPPIEMSARHNDPKAAVAAPGAKAAKKKSAKSSKPTLAGKWTGVAIIDKGYIPVKMSAKLKAQSNDIFGGKIKMGAVMGDKPIKSNLIIDPYNNCRMVLAGNGSVGGLTAAASPDGKSIVGRWTWNVNGRWVTGTFKLTKILK